MGEGKSMCFFFLVIRYKKKFYSKIWNVLKLVGIGHNWVRVTFVIA